MKAHNEPSGFIKDQVFPNCHLLPFGKILCGTSGTILTCAMQAQGDSLPNSEQAEP